MAVAQLDEGWPLGLQPLNVRPDVMARNGDFSGSVSFNTLLSNSPTSASSSSSSDLDTESTGSFFHDRRITLGSLIGVRSILDISNRSLRGRRRTRQDKTIKNKKYKPKSWFFFSLCSPETTTDAHAITTRASNCASLGHFLEEERRVRRNNNLSPTIYGPDGFSLTSPRAGETNNTLFVNGHIAPPPRQTSPCSASDKKRNIAVNSTRGCGDPGPVMFSISCIGGRPGTSH